MAHFMFEVEFWNRLVSPMGLKTFLLKRGMSARLAEEKAKLLIDEFRSGQLDVDVPETASLVATMAGLQLLPGRTFERRWVVMRRNTYP